MYAILTIGAKQYKVAPGEFIRVEKMDNTPGSEAVLKNVVAVHDKELHVGSPYLENAGVVCNIIETERGPKIRMYKYKRRKGSKRKRAHRQPYTLLQVKDVFLSIPDTVIHQASGTKATETSGKVKVKKVTKKAPIKKTTKKKSS